MNRPFAIFAVLFFAGLTADAAAQTTFTWDGGGADNNWGTGANWAGDVAPSGDTGNNRLVFSGTTRPSTTNNLGNWSLSVGQLEFASGAASFTLSGDNFGFQPYLGNSTQQIFQNSANTQTIGVGAFSFRNGADSQINLNAGDLVITSPNMFIDSAGSVRSLIVAGSDTTRRTVTFAGNVNKGLSGQDPDLVIQNNKRVLVTGSLTFGTGNDASVFVNSGVLQFSGSGTMTGGRPLLGDSSGSAYASLFLDTAGATFARQIELRSGSSGRRTIGGLNTSGTVTFSGDFAGGAEYDLAAATGGTTVISGTRNFNGGLYVNRPDGATTYGGTVVLSGSTTSTEFTALEGGTLQFGDLNQLGAGHFEFNAASGDSGTLRYTGGTATNTRTLWIDNPGITRAAIDVQQAGTALTWNPGDGNINQNLTKVGAGTLILGGGRITGAATVGVEAGVLILTASNSYSGGTTVTGGTLQVSGATNVGGSANALGTSSVSIGSGGRVQYQLSESGAHTISNAFTLSGGTLHTEDGANTYAAQVTLASGNSTISARYEDVITLSGGLTGSGNVVFTQSGGTGAWAAPTYVLPAAGSNTGTVRVNGSSGGGATKLQLANVNALQNATLDLATGDTGSVEFTVAGANTYVLGGLQGTRNLALGANSLSVGGNNADASYSGSLSGTGALFKTGAGTMTLSGANTYSGGTTVSAGVLAVNTVADTGTSALGNSGTFSLAGGTLRYTGTASNTTARVFDISTANTSSTIDVSEASGQLALTGKVWNSATNHPNVVLNKTGAGVLSIGGAGANRGLSLAAREGTTILAATTNAVYEVRALDTGATIRLANNFQIFGGDAIVTTGNIRMTGGTLDLNGFNETVDRLSGAELTNAGTGIITSATAATFTVGNSYAGRASQFAGSLQGALNLAIKGSNTVTLSGNNTYSGTTTVNAGTLQIGNGGTSGTLGTGAVTNNASLVFNRSDNLTVANTISGSGSLRHAGSGTMTLSGVNTYSRGTTVEGGRLVGNATSLQGAITNSGVVEFNQQSNGTLNGTMSGDGSLAKTGAGNLTISNTQTFSGGTTVFGGGLIVNGALTASPVKVESGARLSGSGSIGGLTVVGGGTINPGNSPGAMVVNGNALWLGGGNYDWEIHNAAPSAGAGSGWDLISLTGTLDLTQLTVDSRFNINLWSLSSLPQTSGEALNFDSTQTGMWTILTASGGINGFSADKFSINTAAVNGTGGFANSLQAGWGFSIEQDGNNLNLRYAQQVAPAPVPEPGTWAAAALLVGGAAYMRWRQRRWVAQKVSAAAKSARRPIGKLARRDGAIYPRLHCKQSSLTLG